MRRAQKNSAVFNHFSNLSHDMNWNNAEILYKSKCEYKRKIIESALIEIIPNFNLSRGQWSPDPITSMVMGQVLPKGLVQTDRLTVPPGHVT